MKTKKKSSARVCVGHSCGTVPTGHLSLPFYGLTRRLCCTDLHMFSGLEMIHENVPKKYPFASCKKSLFIKATPCTQPFRNKESIHMKMSQLILRVNEDMKILLL